MTKKALGFSLIEIMIVVAIIGIISAIAYPSYSESVRKSKRADAKDALNKAAALQEKHYLGANQYSIDLDDLGGSSSPAGHYTMTVAYTLGGTSCATDMQCYTITATATGAQAKDTDCVSLALDSLGRKFAVDDSSNDSAGICW